MLDTVEPIQLERILLDHGRCSPGCIDMPPASGGGRPSRFDLGMGMARPGMQDPDSLPLRAGLIDSHCLSRECLVGAFDRSRAGLSITAFSTVQEAASAAAPDLDLILYHSHAPGPAGMMDVPILRQKLPRALLIILSDAEDAEQPHVICNALRHGARGFIPTRTMGIPMIVAAIRFVRAGGTYAPLDLLLSLVPQRNADMLSTRSRSPLTSRELTVLGHVHQGKANKLIAYELGMKESTVKVHVRHIMRKTGATNRVQAAYTAQTLWDLLPAQRTADARS